MADQVTRSQMRESVRPHDSEAAVGKPYRPRFIVRFSFIALVIVLMASGLVGLRDVLFATFASAYFVLFGKYVYPCPTKEQPPSFFPNNRLLKLYIAFAGIIAIHATVAYILGSFVKGDQAAMKAASPHLFLMVCQVLSETTAVSLWTPVSLPVRMMVPVFYNTRRLFTIATWMETEFSRTTDDRGWLLFGRGLAAANMAIWSFNLFCFLLPVNLPICMKKHSELERISKERQA